MPWEYEIAQSKNPVYHEPGQRKQILNKYGREDWECFHIEHFNTYTAFTFKRFVKPPPKPRKKKEPIKKE